MGKNRPHSSTSVIRKILAAFLLLCTAIFFAIAIARFSFREMVGTMNKITAPNEKLDILSDLFEEITTLDQTQRAEAIENPHKPYHTFIDQSVSINDKIDSLILLENDSSQVSKLIAMKRVLHQRNELFFSYLKVKANLFDNKEFSGQLDTLAAILNNDQLTLDSSIIQSHKKITTTFLRDSNALVHQQDQRSLIRKLFSKRKKQVPLDTPKIRVQEELSFVLDTAALARQNEALIEIERLMKNMERDQFSQRKKLQRQELELVHANGLLINQLLNILHAVERQELDQMQANNGHAVQVMNQSIARINYLTLAFFVAAAILVYFIWLDISKSNFYKLQLEKARDKAEELSKIKQRFLANMSHEIRTPLQSIIGFAEQLKKRDSTAPSEVEAIHSSSEHLLQIVNEVLDFSRISSGNFSLAQERFKLSSVIREVESAMRIQAEKKNLAFTLEASKTSEFIMGDPFRLRQILYNLLGNAIKFTSNGFIKLNVKTQDEGSFLRCYFEISDSGIGIEPQQMGRIFNQFEQANDSITQSYGGTGLGLTIVKALVDTWQGSIEVSSQPGIGSSFRVELLFPKAADVKNDLQITPAKPASATFKGKVMVVDDDALILRLCGLILTKYKIDFVTRQDATALIGEQPDPSITHIFMDIRMPGTNGQDLCRILKRTYRSGVQFIALTAHVIPEEKNDVLRDGFDQILTKPFHEQEMLRILEVDPIATAPIQEEVPDLDLLKRMTMGDEALYHSILNQFIEETRADLIVATRCADSCESKPLREVVHKLAGRLAQVGISGVSGRLRSVELELEEGKTVNELSEDVQGLFRKINDIVLKLRLTTQAQLN